MKSALNMNDDHQIPPAQAERKPVGTLVDFVDGAEETNPLRVEIGFNDRGRVIIFHDKPFIKPVDWFEYHVKSADLNFIMNDGEVRNIGMKIDPSVGKNMQNTHQILMVLMDDRTGQAKKGTYIPVILHD